MQTLVLGASLRPFRTSYEAMKRLHRRQIDVKGVGIQAGNIEGIPIVDHIDELELDELDTITLYLAPQNQQAYYQWILDQKPRRVIFNPGAENPEFERMLTQAGIKAMRACTLVMLATDQY